MIDKMTCIVIIVIAICLTIYGTTKVYVEGMKEIQQRSQQVIER